MELSLLKDVLDFSHQRVTNINVVAENSADSCPVAIYCSLIELAKSYHTLVSNLDLTGSLSVARTFLEYYIELAILLDDPTHNDHVYFEFYHSKNRMLTDLRKMGEEIRSKFSFLEKERVKIQSNLKKFGDKCGLERPMSIRKKFSKAKSQDLYVSMYGDLCEESHCNLSALINRHFTENEETGKLQIGLYNTDNASRYYSFASTIALILIKIGSQLVSKRNNIDLTREYKEMEFVVDKRFNESHP